MSKSMMQKLYEWSMRTADPTKYDPVHIDKEKIVWLQEAWSHLFQDGQTILRKLLEMLEDPNESIETKEQILEELSLQLEHIDMSAVMKPLGGWDTLQRVFLQNISVQANKTILKLIAQSIPNAADIQNDVMSSNWFRIFKEQLENLGQYNQKELLGVLSGYYQNVENAHKLHDFLNTNFIKVYKQKGFDQGERFKYLCQQFSEREEDDKQYVKLIRSLVE